MPASVQALAYAAVQIWSLVTKPSAMTSLTFALVIDSGSSRTDGMVALVCGSVVVPVAVVGFWFFARAIARPEAASASFLIA